MRFIRVWMVTLYRNCKGDAPTTFMKCGIKNALGMQTHNFLKRAHWLNTYPLVTKDFARLLNTIFIKKLLEIASEVVVHRITQVGRIRADY